MNKSALTEEILVRCRSVLSLFDSKIQSTMIAFIFFAWILRMRTHRSTHFPHQNTQHLIQKHYKCTDSVMASLQAIVNLVISWSIIIKTRYRMTIKHFFLIRFFALCSIASPSNSFQISVVIMDRYEWRVCVYRHIHIVMCWISLNEVKIFSHEPLTRRGFICLHVSNIILATDFWVINDIIFTKSGK